VFVAANVSGTGDHAWEVNPLCWVPLMCIDTFSQLEFHGSRGFFRGVCTFAKSANWFRHVHLSVRMCRSGFHRTDVCEIWYWWLLRKSVIVIHLWLKWGKISCNLHEDLCVLYCCQRNKLAIKALLFLTQYFHIFCWYISQQCIDSELCFCSNIRYKNTPLCYLCCLSYCWRTGCWVPARVTLGCGPQLMLIRAITDSDLSCWCCGMLIGRKEPISVKAYWVRQ
jgi:hypothetical protein